ncbi:MAG: GCN5 family acetyltransferase [Dehalococcoidia bacterium]|nr:MAG: GCN5 family acetyltransferase [Dehalococcoidia bacterium]
MEERPASGLVRRSELSGEERAALEELLARCNAHDGLELPIDFDRGLDPKPPWLLAFAGNQLAGAALLTHYGELEAWLVVDPAWRRRGVGRRLLDAVREVIEGQFLLVCDASSTGGVAFLRAVGAVYRFSEHRMQFQPELPRATPSGRVRVRSAVSEDAPTLKRVTAAAFGDAREEVGRLIDTRLGDPRQRWFITELESQPIGAIRAQVLDRSAYLATFGIIPTQQRQGYGRDTLALTVATLLADGIESIFLEVETENHNALGLYESCGFRTTRTYQYHAVG